VAGSRNDRGGAGAGGREARARRSALDEVPPLPNLPGRHHHLHGHHHVHGRARHTKPHGGADGAPPVAHVAVVDLVASSTKNDESYKRTSACARRAGGGMPGWSPGVWLAAGCLCAISKSGWQPDFCKSSSHALPRNSASEATTTTTIAAGCDDYNDYGYDHNYYDYYDYDERGCVQKARGRIER